MNDKPRWQEDFPISWVRDHYVSRRELAKFLALGSALLAGANALLAIFGKSRAGRAKAVRIARASEVTPGRSRLFRYPTDDDPCILLRTAEGRLAAYSQVCTHLSCAVVHRPEKNMLYCPCHEGSFSCNEGRPIAGPPTRALPRIQLEVRGDDVFATGVEV